MHACAYTQVFALAMMMRPLTQQELIIPHYVHMARHMEAEGTPGKEPLKKPRTHIPRVHKSSFHITKFFGHAAFAD